MRQPDWDGELLDLEEALSWLTEHDSVEGMACRIGSVTAALMNGYGERAQQMADRFIEEDGENGPLTSEIRRILNVHQERHALTRGQR